MQPIWVDEHADEPATVMYGTDAHYGVYGTTVRKAIETIGGMQFRYTTTNDGTAHFFEVLV